MAYGGRAVEASGEGGVPVKENLSDRKGAYMSVERQDKGSLPLKRGDPCPVV